jgi:calcium-dependent protein kinase
MDHPNIVKLYEVFEDQVKFYVVTEICRGGELFDEIMRREFLSEKDSAIIMRQVLEAVIYCHS